MRKILTLTLITCCLTLAACHRTKQNAPVAHGTKTMIVKMKQTGKTLYFAGTIKPFKTSMVVSPVDGTVSKLNFSYGGTVKKGQLLLAVQSSTQHTEYQDALTKYLQAKQTFIQSQGELAGDQKLFDQGLIPRNDYNATKNTHLFNHLALLQAEEALKKTIPSHHLEKIRSLSIDNFQEVNKALELEKKDSAINVYAPTMGDALFSKDQAKKMTVGSKIKKGDVLLFISQSNGVSLDVKISEMDVNMLHVGQAATITSVAFPNIKLKGYIEKMDAQAGEDSDQPTFSATVVVSSLTAAQAKIIRFGMSAKISIETTHKPKLLIPLSAIEQKGNKYYVTILDPKTKQKSTQEITVGDTTFQDVTVLSGLKTGDEIVLPD